MTTIRRLRVSAVAFGSDEYSWSALMPSMLNTDTVVRIDTSDGLQGWGAACSCVEHDIDLSVAHGTKPMLPGLLGRDASQIDELWEWMSWRKPYVTNPSIAAIDMALWDLAAQRAGVPLHRHLGAAADRLPAYASIPVLEDPQANIDLIERLADDGFSTFKFHYKSVPEPDIELIRVIHQTFGPRGFRFMFDAECAYDLEQATAVGSAAADAGFVWLEAPLADRDLAGYAELRRRVDVDVLPAGLTVADEQDLANALTAEPWSRVRTDAAACGGITPLLRIAALADRHGLKTELQSWGSSMSTIANFQASLALSATDWFEVPVPRADFDVPGVERITVDEAGHAVAPTAPGLGLIVDWDEFDAASQVLFDVS